MLVCACVKESQCQCMYVRVCVRNFIDNNNVIYIWCGSMKMKAECEMKSSLPLRVNLCGFMLVVLLYLHILVKHFIHTAVTNQNIWAFFWALCLYIVKKKKNGFTFYSKREALIFIRLLPIPLFHTTCFQRMWYFCALLHVNIWQCVHVIYKWSHVGC